MSEETLAMVAAMGLKDTIDVENVVIEAPDLKTKEERMDQEIGSPPGFNYRRERDEHSLLVRIGGAVLCENAHHAGQLDEVIEKRRKLLPKVRAKTIHLTMINFSKFPFDKIEAIIRDIEFEKLCVTMRGVEADPSLLAFISRHADKEISLSLEDSLLDTPSLLALPRLASIDAYWLSGFRGVWTEGQGINAQDFVELVKKGHSSLLLPVDIEEERVLVEVVKLLEASDFAQRVTLRIRPPLRDRFHTLLGLECSTDGDWTVDESTGFSITDAEESNSLQYGEKTIKMRWALTRKHYGPGSMQFYFVFIENALSRANNSQ